MKITANTMNQGHGRTAPMAPPSRPRGLRAIFAAIVDQILLWQTRDAERRHLAELTPHELADIGLRHAEARREAAKPFWRE